MEVWKNIGDYEVSSTGRVWSKISNKYLKPTLADSGYLILGSGLGSVHRLVVSTFLGEIPKGLVVNHLDGDKQHNDIANLEITTYSENLRHAFRLGLACNKGSRNSQSKVCEEDILEMYKLFLAGFNNKSVAEKYGLHDRYVSLIRHGKRWLHVYSTYGKIFPKSFNYKFSPEKILYVRTLIGLGYKNKDIEGIVGIERSNISRIRNRGLYGEFYKTWYEYGIATTRERLGKEKDFTENRVL